MVEDDADLLHLDVMDGHFVPNISFGMPVISSIRSISALPFDCHIMTTNPTVYLEELAEAGADILCRHGAVGRIVPDGADHVGAPGIRWPGVHAGGALQSGGSQEMG